MPRWVADSGLVSLVILADSHPRWRPTRYERELWGTRSVVEFCVFKLLDLRGAEAGTARLAESLRPLVGGPPGSPGGGTGDARAPGLEAAPGPGPVPAGPGWRTRPVAPRIGRLGSEPHPRTGRRILPRDRRDRKEQGNGIHHQFREERHREGPARTWSPSRRPWTAKRPATEGPARVPGSPPRQASAAATTFAPPTNLLGSPGGLRADSPRSALTLVIPATC